MQQTSQHAEQMKYRVHIFAFMTYTVKNRSDGLGNAAGQHELGAEFTHDLHH